MTPGRDTGLCGRKLLVRLPAAWSGPSEAPSLERRAMVMTSLEPTAESRVSAGMSDLERLRLELDRLSRELAADVGAAVQACRRAAERAHRDDAARLVAASLATIARSRRHLARLNAKTPMDGV
jgi:hypothetical protein